MISTPPYAPALQARRQAVRRGAATLIALCVAFTACTTPPLPPKPPPTGAHAPREDSPFAAIEAGVRSAHDEQTSGFALLRRNEDALRWRLALIDNARHSLDLQYYVWFGDAVGQLLMARVVAAADRGVRVRLLFDDLNTLLHDMSHVELRDATLARLDRHPRIEIRVFNAWRERTLLGRAAESVWDFERLNRRMHNKQMVADNRVAVIGGRNIGNEYFGLNAEFNFHDLDVLGVGPVAREASAVFDRYWNSDWVRRIPRSGGAAADGEPASAAEQEAMQRLQSDPRARAVLAGNRDWGPELRALSSRLHAGRSTVHTDSPSRGTGTHNHMPDAFRELMLGANREVLITNAYVIPDARFVDDLRGLVRRGVRVKLLTNSLASHDVPAVNSHYEGWREALLLAGVELYELRHQPQLQAQWVDTPPVRGRFVGLHTKAMVIDRRIGFVGSMNLDPRSAVINAEMGVRVDSEALARELADAMAQDMSPANSWAVLRDARGALRWTAGDVLLEQQPARSAWQRVQNLLFKLLPSSLY